MSYEGSRVKSYPTTGQSFPIPVIACVIFGDFFDSKLTRQANNLLRHMTGESTLKDSMQLKAWVLCALVLTQGQGKHIVTKRTEFNKMKAALRTAKTKEQRAAAYKLLTGSNARSKLIHKLSGDYPRIWRELRDG